MAITNIAPLSSRSLLSQATYAKANEAGPRYDEALRRDAAFTPTQIAAFNARYEFIHSQPNELNGFRATLYKDKTTNQYVFAARGTELNSLGGVVSDGLIADLAGIGVMGYANLQAASMYRYWRKLTTADGADVSYSDAELRQMFVKQNGATALLSIPANTVAFGAFKQEVLQDKGVEHQGSESNCFPPIAI